VGKKEGEETWKGFVKGLKNIIEQRVFRVGKSGVKNAEGMGYTYGATDSQ